MSEAGREVPRYLSSLKRSTLKTGPSHLSEGTQEGHKKHQVPRYLLAACEGGVVTVTSRDTITQRRNSNKG